MPYVSNQGVRIHYQVEGDGPPLVLQHGITWNLRFWYYRGYVDALKGDYRLILIDARGHGASDKPHDPTAYNREAKVSDICAVLDALDIARSHFWGYSMGCSIGMALGLLRPDRFHSLILGAYGALPPEPTPGAIARWEARASTVRKKGMKGYVAEYEKANGPMPEDEKADILADDPEAIAACSMGNLAWGVPEDAPSAVTLPVLAYAGEQDGRPPESNYERTKRTAAKMPNARFISIPDLDHMGVFRKPDLIIPHALEFMGKLDHLGPGS